MKGTQHPRLQSPVLGTQSAKDSEDGSGSQTFNIAPSLLDSFIPGYAVISKFILGAFGIDIGVFVSAALLFVTAGTSLRFIWTRIASLCSLYSSIHIIDHDDMFESALEWVMEQPYGKAATTLKAVSKSVGDNDEDELEEKDEMSESVLFHAGKMAKVPPKYEPFFGVYYFFQGGRLFFFERGRKDRNVRSPWDRQTEEEHLKFTTLGWSTLPIKKLLTEIKEWAAEGKTALTVIKRPSPKERARAGTWTRAMERPSRPMNTVLLPSKQKAEIIADVHEYLLPSTRRWYARRGIPYRRGYLFHGPPGTGKSSLSFALAGLFGLNVFLISLLDPTLTESDLQALFNNLPRRCIVLLEDIDSAGLKRPDLPDGFAAPRERNSAKTSRSNKSSGTQEETVGNGISLSGLLNAIDGVASHEGRVLVMTTNHPDKLDDALIRPGRVDMKIEFTLATEEQIKEIFMSMYSSDLNSSFDGTGEKPSRTIGVKYNRSIASNGVVQPSNGILGLQKNIPEPEHAAPATIPNIEGTTLELLMPLLEKRYRTYTFNDLHNLAEQFVECVPELEFSPAEVQNFLIPRKNDPWKAVNQAEQWAMDLKKAKVERKKAQELLNSASNDEKEKASKNKDSIKDLQTDKDNKKGNGSLSNEARPNGVSKHKRADSKMENDAEQG